MLFAFFSSPKAHAQSLSVELSKRMYAGGYNITCHGGSDGRVSAQVSGGTAPYTISWNTGATGTPLDNIPAGTYTVTVTDANNATVSASITLIQPSALGHEKLVSSYNGYQISAYGAQTGSIQITPTGGTPPYTVDWGNNITGQIRENLGMGTYSYTITDANACSQQGSQVMNQPDELIISFSNIQGVSCYEGENGSVQTTVSGGVGPYAYHWDNGSFAQNPENLSAGEHTLMVEDGNANKKTVTVTIPGPDKLNIDFQLSQFNNGNNVGCYSCHDGSISTTVSGGTAPYTYEWNDPLGSTTANLSQLSGGNYDVTVTDANQCTQKSGVELRMPAFEGWSMQGNTGIDPNSQFIGTSDSADVVMKVNNGEVMRLKSDRIVFGASKFVFNNQGNIVSFTESGGPGMGLLLRDPNKLTDAPPFIEPVTCGNLPSNQFYLMNDGYFRSYSSSVNAGHSVQMLFGSDGNQGVIETSQGSPLFSNSRLLINYGCGADVFVGNQNSGALVAKSRLGVRTEDFDLNGATLSFRVNGFSLFDKAILIRDTVGEIALGSVNGYGNNFLTLNGNVPAIQLLENAKGGSISYTNGATRLTSDHSFLVFLDGDNQSNGNQNEEFRILSHGAYDGGSAKDLLKLNHEGRLYVRAFHVTVPDPVTFRYPDYVFKDDYPLPSFSDWENEIKKLGHLPGFPSEEEIKKQGSYDLAELTLKLLEQQEIMTLKMIELYKENQEIKKQLNLMNNKK